MADDALPPPPPGFHTTGESLPPPPPGFYPTGEVKPATPPPYDSDQGPYKDLPVWLRPDNAFMRFSRMAEHGATLGLSSEVKPVAELAKEAIKQHDLGASVEAYHKAKQAETERVAQGRQEFGLVPEIIGGMGSVRAGPGAAAPAIAPTASERIGSAAKAGAGFGAVSGATEGDGTFGERLENAGKGALAGAVAGPLLSEVAVPAVAKTLGVLTPGDRVGHAIRTIVPGVKEDVDRKLYFTLRDQGMTPDQAWAALEKARAAAKFGQTQLDPYYTMADLGPGTQQLAYSAKSGSGPAKAYSENFLEARAKGSDQLGTVSGYQGPNMRGQHERVEDYTQRALQAVRDKNAARVEDRLKEAQKAAKDPAYNAFHNFPGTIPVEDILQAHAADMASKVTTGSKLAREIDAAYEPFMDEPHGIGVTQMPSLTEQAQYNLAMMRLNKQIQKAEDAGDAAQSHWLQMKQAGLVQKYQAKQQPQDLTQISYDLSPEKFDSAKKQLDGMIRAARNNKTDPNAKYRESLLLDLKHNLVQRADEVTAHLDPSGNPILDKEGNVTSLYRDARESFSDPQDIIDAISEGRKFKKIDIDRINQTLKDYGTAAERKGFRIGAATDIRQDLGEIPRGGNVAKYFNKPNMEVRMKALAGPKRAAQHESLMDIENQMAGTRTKVNQGSRTEENKQANEEQAMWLRIGRKMANPLAALHDLVGTSIAHLYRYRKMDALQIARALFDTNPARQKATIDRLNARYGPQSVTAAMQHARTLAARAVASGTSGVVAANRANTEQHAFGGSVNNQRSIHALRLDEIERGSIHPEEKRNLRRAVIEDALRNP